MGIELIKNEYKIAYRNKYYWLTDLLKITDKYSENSIKGGSYGKAKNIF